MYHRRLATRQHKPPFPERRHDQDRDDGHEQQRDERVEAVVEDQPRRIGVGRPCERRGVRQESEPRIGREDLLPSGGHRDGHEPGERRGGHPGEPPAAHLDENRGPDAQRHRCQELVRDPEQRPQRVDSAERVHHALIQEVSPPCDDHAAGRDHARIPRGLRESRPDVAHDLLQHEPAHAGPGVDGGEDEQGFEHDGEVVPQGVEGLPPSALVAPAKIWAIPTASDGAPPERARSVVSPMRAASSRMKSGVTTNPAWPSTCDACASAAGVVFIAKYTPGSSVQAAIIAITPTNDSISMPPYPMSRASASRAIILGVVPDATSEWKPEIAPHAIVMNANGNSFPANTGPSPSVANGVSAGMRSGGRITRIAIASTRIVVIFRNVER